MRILHTADWHLGKNLESFSRLEEQKMFIDELADICDKNNVDIIIVAGDIYDTSNHPAKAEELFYKGLRKLSKDGMRPVVIIAGNHDSPNRIMVSNPIIENYGILLLGDSKEIVKIKKHNGFSVVDSGEGYFEINKNDENIVILAIPYLSEKNLDELISETIEEKEFQKNYSDKVKYILESNSCKFRDDTINIVTGHFFVLGGENSGSERNIQIGGSYAVNGDAFPKKAQYVALGHLHRVQSVKTNSELAYYSGSPIQYSKSEAYNSKCVILADIVSGKKADINKVYLSNYKPVEVWKAENIETAIKMCHDKSNENCYVFLDIMCDRVLMQSEIKKLHSYKKDIVEIQAIFEDNKNEFFEYETEEKSLKEQFENFYFSCKNVMPSKESVDLFLSVAENYD